MIHKMQFSDKEMEEIKQILKNHHLYGKYGATSGRVSQAILQGSLEENLLHKFPLLSVPKEICNAHKIQIGLLSVFWIEQLHLNTILLTSLIPKNFSVLKLVSVIGALELKFVPVSNVKDLINANNTSNPPSYYTARHNTEQEAA